MHQFMHERCCTLRVRAAAPGAFLALTKHAEEQRDECKVVGVDGIKGMLAAAPLAFRERGF